MTVSCLGDGVFSVGVKSYMCMYENVACVQLLIIIDKTFGCRGPVVNLIRSNHHKVL